MAKGSEREHWGGRLGFVLAAVGSAVGLGNMWRFSYIAAENGGAAFVLLYLVMTFAVGLPVLLAELVIGRGAQRSPIGAVAHFFGDSWRPLGALFVLAGVLIFSYYSVIAGWTLRYTFLGLVGGFSGDAGERFAQVASGPVAIAWHLGFMAMTVVVVAGGVRRGIERCALVLMPLLFGIVVGLAIYAATLEGAGAGYRYYLDFDFAKLWSVDVFRDAAGQAFFSLSLGMGAMMTFASYLQRDHPVARESVTIAFSDFAVAFVAGLVVFPLIFALGLQTMVGESTVGALFITLPEAFQAMGLAGRVVGVLFFAALVVGALTSAISILEVVVASATERLGWSRRRASVRVGIAIAALGVLPALDTDLLGLMDLLAGNVLLIAGGLGLALSVGFVSRDARSALGESLWVAGWVATLRWIVPPVLAVALFYALAGFWEAAGHYVAKFSALPS
jgi:NSS family neurotransmitter:Na+ symporter